MARAARACQGMVLGLLTAALVAGHPGGVEAKPQPQRSAASHRSAAPAQAKANTRPLAHAQPKSTSPKRVASSARRSSAPGRAPAARAGSARAVQVAFAGRPPAVTGTHDAVRPLVVIDAGHGGRDPGAVGAAGTREKDITLAIAQDLRRALESTGRYRTAMTRTRDQFVPLSDRLSFARRHDADLMIAIHADASKDRQARGASVYVSSGQGVGRLVANAGSAGQIARALTDVAPRPAPNSAWLQYSMIDQLADEVKMVVAPARAAHLYVLGSRSIPSVLLETGFISNKQDEALLKQSGHRRRLVGAVTDAIDDYFDGVRAKGPRT